MNVVIHSFYFATTYSYTKTGAISSNAESPIQGDGLDFADRAEGDLGILIPILGTSSVGLADSKFPSRNPLGLLAESG